MNQETSGPPLTSEQQRALARVLDEIIPPRGDGKLPGAGELGLVDYIQQVLGRTPELGPVIREGLSALEALASRRGSQGFASLPRAQRLELLNALATQQEAFLPSLIFHAYVGYYQQPRVLEGLGLEPRPPHPRGYEMEPSDLSLLDAVRRRPKLYREC